MLYIQLVIRAAYKAMPPLIKAIFTRGEKSDNDNNLYKVKLAFIIL